MQMFFAFSVRIMVASTESRLMEFEMNPDMNDWESRLQPVGCLPGQRPTVGQA
jgi:hypothetical protein